MAANENVVVLLSGGLDSAVLTYWLKERYTKVYPLYIKYGSKHSSKELKAAQETCKDLGLELTVIEVPEVLFSNAALTNEAMPVPKSLEDTIQVVVPFRNLMFITFGAAYAEQVGATTIALSPTKEDYSVFRDCRREFFDSAEKTLSLGSKYERSFAILTPFINYTKEDIITLGVKMDVNFAHTWSCYLGESEPCGTCPACRVRMKGFGFAGVSDPLVKVV